MGWASATTSIPLFDVSGDLSMQKFAVIGNPIAHSRSPEIHQAFGQQRGISLSYDKILAADPDFEAEVMTFFALGGQGLNVTVPFKERAFRLCGAFLTPRAKAAQAVNTLFLQDGVIWGDNTDGAGLVQDLQRLGWPLSGARLLILGAGGATRGVILPLLDAGVSQLVIANRTLSRAEQLQADFGDARLTVLTLDQLSGDFDGIINATSASLSGEGLKLPDGLHFQHAYEMAYGKPSDFMAQAQQRGVPVADGLGMLVGQAAVAFECWHGVMPETAAVLQQLSHSSPK